MRQKDLRTRVAEVEAEAKGSCIETEEEEQESPNIKLRIIMGLVMVGIVLYMMLAMLQKLKG